MTDDAAAIRRRLWVLAAIILAAGLLAWALRGVDWGALGALLASVDPAGLAVAAGLTTLSLMVRALRWRLLLGGGGRQPLTIVFWAAVVGHLANAYLPARAGDVLRSLLLARVLARRVTFVLGTTLAERVWDVLIVVALGAAALAWNATAPAWLGMALIIAGGGALAVIAALALLPKGLAGTAALMARLVRNAATRRRLRHGLLRLAIGSHRLRAPDRAARFAALSVGGWCLDAATLIVVAGALGLTLSPQAGLLLVVALALASAAPSTPGYVGLFQAAAVSVLVPLGFSDSAAIAVILAYQAQTYAVVTVFGGLGLLLLRAPRGAMAKSRRSL